MDTTTPVIKTPFHHRQTQKKKEANDYAWYKHHIDLLDSMSFANVSGFGGVSEYRRMQANYDLYNNIIDPSEFEYICRPYGDAVGELPADFTNRDITSGKIKVLLGIEMKRPFSWKVVAVNEEATTRKEQEEFNRIREFVVGEVLGPVIADIRKKALEQTQGQQLTEEQAKQLEQQVQQEVAAATPEEIRKYMERKHQDPAEVLAHQLLEYLIEKVEIRDKFNDGWKHALLSGLEVYWEGEGAGMPDVRVINPLHFDYDRSPDIKYIEDGEWACCEYSMTPSQVVAFFGNELTEKEIDQIYSMAPYDSLYQSPMPDARFLEFSFNENRIQSVNNIRVFHANFKSLKKVVFLTYMDLKTGKIHEMMVDENYRFNPENGDIKIEVEWIPEAHEGYKIGTIYKRMRPVPGQYKDITNLYHCKLSYKGAAYDNTNSEITSLMDRMKSYQFYYNIIMYRIEMLMASDKGKLLLLNMNMLPESQGININKFAYYAETLHIGFLNPNEEGNRGGQSDVVNAAKEIDMSLASDIQKYINMAEYIEMRCGASVGITKEMEGQTPPQGAVANSQMNYTQSSFIIEPYFELHNQIKKNLIEGLLETAKVFYSKGNVSKLSYVIDDFSTKLLDINSELLDNSTYGLFVSNSSKAAEAKQAVQQLSQAAMQNQKAELSDIVKIIRSESVQEAEELLSVAEGKAHEREMQLQQQQSKAQQDMLAQQEQYAETAFEREKELIVLKEEERRKTEIEKQLILSMGFNTDKDMDEDGKPDVLEVAKMGVDADIKMRKQKLDELKFQHQQEMDRKASEQADKKLKIDEKKASQKPKSK